MVTDGCHFQHMALYLSLSLSLSLSRSLHDFWSDVERWVRGMKLKGFFFSLRLFRAVNLEGSHFSDGPTSLHPVQMRNVHMDIL